MIPVRKKILIVDDETALCDSLSKDLAEAGYETATAPNGQEGLKQANQFEPRLILLDVIMPVMDGWEMLKRLKSQPGTKNIPVILLTSKTDAETIFKSQKEKVLDFFTKPIDSQELIAFIQRYIG